MGKFLLGALLTLAVLAAGGAWLWFRAPEHLPLEWRRQNPQSIDYQPVVYRWKDDQGRTQLSDQPPAGRDYETLRIDPHTNVVPALAPATGDD